MKMTLSRDGDLFNIMLLLLCCIIIFAIVSIPLSGYGPIETVKVTKVMGAESPSILRGPNKWTISTDQESEPIDVIHHDPPVVGKKYGIQKMVDGEFRLIDKEDPK